jgi:hypothetical protein
MQPNLFEEEASVARLCPSEDLPDPETPVTAVKAPIGNSTSR